MDRNTRTSNANAESGCPERLVRDREADQITGTKRTWRRQAEKAGVFPQRRLIGGRVTGYLYSELVAWMLARPVNTQPAPAAAMRARGFGVGA